MSTKEEIEAALRRRRDDYQQGEASLLLHGCDKVTAEDIVDAVRRDDDRTLADAFVDGRAERQRRIEAAAMEIYTGISYQWPADVREVERVLARHLGEAT